MKVGVLGSYNIKYVGEISCVADKLQDSRKFFFLQSVNVIDGDDDGTVNLLESAFDTVVCVFERTIPETLNVEGERNLGPPWGNLG